MIFVTLGSQKFQFNRLLKKLDELVEQEMIKDEIFAQIGYSEYLPRRFEYTRFTDRDDYSKIMDRSEIVITHGGTGAIIGAVKKEKKIIAVPRIAKYGEHIDDHQCQIVDQFVQLNLIYGCYEIGKLYEDIEFVKQKTFSKYTSNTDTIIKSIQNFIER